MITRKEFLKGSAVTTFLALIPTRSAAIALPARLLDQGQSKRLPQAKVVKRPPPLRITAKRVRLDLKHTWTISRESSDFKDNVILKLEKDGVFGFGEAAPSARYHEDWQSALNAIEHAKRILETADPWQFAECSEKVHREITGEYAAKAAIDIALHDWVGKKLGIPLYRYFGLDKSKTPITTFSIGIDTLEVMKAKVKEAADFPILKIKVGLKNDEEIIKAIRSVTNKPLRVDANEGWRSKEEALEKINWLATQGVEFVEQPMPSTMLEEMRWLRERATLPLIADESCLHPEDIPKLVGAFDGIYIKLMKCGGIQPAVKMIHLARALGLKIMLGCMVESSVGITAAAHLSPLVDYADLDGNLLITNDPFSGVKVEQGKLILPDRPGLGVIGDL